MMEQRRAAVIRDIMHKDLEVIPANVTVVDAAERMRARRIGSLLVGGSREGAESADIEGIVTETDFVRKVIARVLPAESTTVEAVMTAPVLTIEAERPIVDASHVMEMNHVRHLCVSDRGRIHGLISVRDLVEHFVDAESGPVRELDDVYRPLSVLMRTGIETLEAGEPFLAAAQRMADKRIGSLVVTEAGRMVGIVTESDLVRNALPYDLASTITTVGSIMSRPLIDIDVNRTVHDASELMAEKGVRHLVVTEHGRVAGILSVRDLIRMISVRDRPRFVAQNKRPPSS